MPAVVVAVAAASAGSYAAGFFVAGSFAAIAASAATAVVVGSVLGRALFKQPTAPEAAIFDQQARGILLNVPSNDAPLPVIYGRRRVGGTVCLLETSTGDQVLHKVVALSEGQLRGIPNVYLDDTISSHARFAGSAQVEVYLGTDAQTASAQLIAQLPGKWTSDHRGRGVGYVYALCVFNQDDWTGEPVVTADVWGKIVYDPRDGAFPQPLDYSSNPACIIRDYLADTRYGRGIPNSAIEDTTFIAAANTCDERVSVPTFSQDFTVSSTEDYVQFSENTPIAHGDGVQFTTTGTLPGGLALATTYYAIARTDDSIQLAVSFAAAMALSPIDITGALGSGIHTCNHIDQARYTVDGVVDTSRQPIDNLRDLLTACRGYLVFSGGTWKLGIDQATAASGFVFNEDNIVGAWEIGHAERFNRVTAKFFNPARQWQPDFAVQESATYRTEDNGRILETEVSLPYTANAYRAARIAQLEMRQSRLDLVVKFRATVAGLRAEVGDVVEITHSTPGWTLKKFRIAGMVLRSDDEVEVTAREYDVGAYTLDALAAVRTAPATNLPNPFDDLEVTLGTPVSGTAELFINGDGTVVPRIRVPFTSANAYIKYFEVQFARSAGSPQDWQDAPDVDRDATNAYIFPVEDGVAYDGRIRAITSLGNAGAWAYFSNHTVVGKTATPSNVTGLSAVQQGTVVLFDSDRVADADLDSVEIRYIEAAGAWANASPLANILRGETMTSAALPPGTWDILAKAKDTSGNYSATEARVSVTVTSTGFTSIVAQEEAPKWLGSRTNMVMHWTRVLVPDSQNLASDDDWETFDEFVPNAYADCYYEAPEIDKSIDASARVWADIVSALGPGETSGVASPRFQIDPRLDAGSYDGFENWTVGSANFRHLKGRVHVDTAIGKPVISGFEINVDNLARAEEFKDQAIGSSGTAITFGTAFHATPVISITPRGTTALIPTAENPTTTGFTAHLYNTSGAGASGSADITATGP